MNLKNTILSFNNKFTKSVLDNDIDNIDIITEFIQICNKARCTLRCIDGCFIQIEPSKIQICFGSTVIIASIETNNSLELRYTTANIKTASYVLNEHSIDDLQNNGSVLTAYQEVVTIYKYLRFAISRTLIQILLENGGE